MNSRLSAVIVAATCTLPLVAHGQKVVIPGDVKEEKVLADKPDKPDGWQLKLGVGATGSLNHSSKVVGQADGSTVQLGGILNGGATLIGGPHEWENTLAYKFTQTRTPQLDEFLKSADDLDFP